MNYFKVLLLSLTAIVTSHAISPTVTAEFKYGQSSNGFQTTTLCIPQIGYCSKPLLYKYEGEQILDQFNAPFDVNKASTDMIIEACMHTDAYLGIQDRTIDCGKIQAAELGPIIGAYSKLYEAYVYESGGKSGSFKDIGYEKISESQFFSVSEIKKGAVFILKSDIHDCKKGSKWILIGKPTPNEVFWTLTEPSNATCKTFLNEGFRQHYNSKF